MNAFPNPDSWQLENIKHEYYKSLKINSSIYQHSVKKNHESFTKEQNVQKNLLILSKIRL